MVWKSFQSALLLSHCRRLVFCTAYGEGMQQQLSPYSSYHMPATLQPCLLKCICITVELAMTQDPYI